jgi:hypothetical protein
MAASPPGINSERNSEDLHNSGHSERRAPRQDAKLSVSKHHRVRLAFRFSVCARAPIDRSGKSDQYVTRRRIEVAQSLMLRSRDPLRDCVALQAEQPTTRLTRLFRRVVGENEVRKTTMHKLANYALAFGRRRGLFRKFHREVAAFRRYLRAQGSSPEEEELRRLTALQENEAACYHSQRGGSAKRRLCLISATRPGSNHSVQGVEMLRPRCLELPQKSACDSPIRGITSLLLALDKIARNRNLRSYGGPYPRPSSTKSRWG